MEAEGDGLTYQWYFKNANEANYRTSSLKTNVYYADMSKAINGRQVYCVITNSEGETLTTDTVTMTLSAIVSGDFVFKMIDDTNNLTLIEYMGNASSITVPGSIDGMTVTEIGVSPLGDGETGVFEGNTTLTSITLPNSITAIREKAFKGCTNLSSMSTY